MKTVLSLVVVFTLTPVAWAQDGAATRLGKSLDNAAKSIRKGVENAVGTVMSGVEQKELQTRAYYRIHWDRALNKAVLRLTVHENGTVVLRGSVADAAAKRRAVELAQTTVGVTAVIDELVVGQARPVRVAPGSPATPDRKTPPAENVETEPVDNP